MRGCCKPAFYKQTELSYVIHNAESYEDVCEGSSLICVLQQSLRGGQPLKNFSDNVMLDLGRQQSSHKHFEPANNSQAVPDLLVKGLLDLLEQALKMPLCWQ